jgi:hypothetical protein
MKKIILVTFIALLGTGTMAQPFAEGAQVVNVGLGFGQTLYSGIGYGFGFPAISASYEYGLKEIPMGAHLNGVISVGGFAGWKNTPYQLGGWGNTKLIYNSYMISARGNYHFIFHEKFDTYAGIHLGFSIISSKWKDDDGTFSDLFTTQSGGFVGGGYVGGRYYFNDNLAVYAELGWMLAILHIGVAYQFYK